MKPVTREEQYLNRLTGEEQEIPEEPVTREEQYLARLCGQTNSIPEKPVTRREEYLANLCGEDVIIPEEQVTRMEQYMAFAAGARETKPEEPVTREEWFWDKYQGGDVPEEKTIAFTDIITVTDALARPAVDLQAEITATQNLNGYEYPWVGGAGKNLFDKSLTSDATSGAKYITLNLAPNTEYTMSSDDPCKNDGTITDLFFCNMDEAVSSNANGVKLGKTVTRTSDANGNLRVGYRCYEEWITPTQLMAYNTQVEIGSTATAYEPYENICPITGWNTATVYHGATEQTAVAITTALGRTVYGGTLDLTTGELKITHAYVDLGDLTWTTSFSEQIPNPNVFGAYINNKKDGYRNFKTTSYRTVKKHEISLANGEATGITKTIGEERTYIFVKDERATTPEEFTTLVTGQKMVYELATPQTISLTPTEVQMLENNNTIWADSGRVQLTYLSKAAQRVQTMNASLQANALKLSGLKKTTKEGGTTK